MTVVVPLLFVWIARTWHDKGATRMLAWLLAGLAIISKVLTVAGVVTAGEWSARTGLPMNLCDWTGFAAMLALIFRWQTAYELAYFWGFGGGLQAMLTPDLPFDFPDPRAIEFFVNHGIALVAVIYLTFAERMRPWPISIVRVFLISQLYLLIALIFDYALDANYGYVRAKPEHASLMDYLGPWPVYLLSLELLSLIFSCLYYAPFFVADKLRASRLAQSG